MAAEDLSTPLGFEENKPAASRRWLGLAATSALWLGLAASGSAIAAAIIWASLVDDPFGGEPIAVAVIERVTPGHTRTVPDAPDRSAPVEQARPAHPVETPGGAVPESGPLIIKVPQNAAASAAKAVSGALDPELAEGSRFGPIPRIAEDGTRPFERYARSTIAEADDKRPKIAIVVGNLGASRDATSKVFELLPRAVTLAFNPYSSDLDKWVGKARADGYEFLLQVPMEPFDYPNNDPGPQALLTSLPVEANSDRLSWAMSRASGYYGLTSFMGGKFLTSEAVLQPVLTEIGRRGLVYLDDGATPASLVSQLGAEAGAVTARAHLVIDAVPEEAAIQAALAELESRARRTGGAIGYASALPVTLEGLDRWVAHLAAKGIALVPVSAVVKLSKPS